MKVIDTMRRLFEAEMKEAARHPERDLEAQTEFRAYLDQKRGEASATPVTEKFLAPVKVRENEDDLFGHVVDPNATSDADDKKKHR